jgi:hypothetical protein
MGQYYKAIILADQKSAAGRQIIRLWSFAHDYGYGAKLMEHSYFDNHFVTNFEYQLTPEGMFYRSRVVWAGEYADEEPTIEGDTAHNLYSLCRENSTHMPLPHHNTSSYRYLINHTMKLYVDKKKEEFHPLPLLTCEGNGLSNGDYCGTNHGICGSWARDVISVEKEPPQGYTELVCGFQEYV